MFGKGAQQFVVGLLSGVFLVAVFIGGAVSEKVWGLPFLRNISTTGNTSQIISQRILSEENVVTDVAERLSPSVVTVSFKQQRPVMEQFFLDPFGMFRGQRPSGEVDTQQVDIGSGFIVDGAGLVVTNKHVVSSGSPGDYTVILKDESERPVERIWRDPANDLAILKISGGGLTPAAYLLLGEVPGWITTFAIFLIALGVWRAETKFKPKAHLP